MTDETTDKTDVEWATETEQKYIKPVGWEWAKNDGRVTSASTNTGLDSAPTKTEEDQQADKL